MSNSDDDMPPDLSSLSCQVAALSQDRGSAISVAAVTGTTPVDDDLKKPTGFKRGFFDRRPAPKSRSASGRSSHQIDGGVEEIIHIKSNASKQQSIPSGFILDQDSPSRQLQQVKQQLTDALKPTPELMKDITTNPNLLQGFDDAEVMAAVSEVARDPASFKKYSHNPKVVAFYREMANFASNQMESKAA